MCIQFKITVGTTYKDQNYHKIQWTKATPFEMNRRSLSTLHDKSLSTLDSDCSHQCSPFGGILGREELAVEKWSLLSNIYIAGTGSGQHIHIRQRFQKRRRHRTLRGEQGVVPKDL
ncbi:hypothetical protein CEXT_423781 [Caerostris extrusa]|uniref:Uncharacterized protein n=1 Tax=Caerostris extrusa TaxID=172846 RepID=A0AAV4Y133_CAEEX|nr:hypothetical protein CEXT_423781 [Caerostris extrusa]